MHRLFLKNMFEEPGSAEYDELLSKVDEVIVSPITPMEIQSVHAKYVKNHWITGSQSERLQLEIKKDFTYFSIILWNENLEVKAAEIVRKYFLKTLDAIQLASGFLSEADLFVTSDQKLYQEAKKILKHVQYI